MPNRTPPFYDPIRLSESEKTIRIPVRIGANGHVEYFYGGPLPKITPGTIGDLVVPERSIIDKGEANRLKRETVVPFLPSRSVIGLAVDGQRTPIDLKRWLTTITPRDSSMISVVQLILDSDLKLRLRGTKPASLEPVTCRIPALEDEAENRNVRSLNHAYRLVSEKFEPHRVSHSGNVFTKGYYLAACDTWVDLDGRRRAAEASVEMLFSRTAAKVHDSLPEKVSSALRECWGGLPQTPEKLKASFEQWRSRAHDTFDADALVYVHEIGKSMKRMLASMSDTMSREHVRLIQAAVTFLIRDGGQDADEASSIRVADKALVVRAVANAICAPKTWANPNPNGVSVDG